MRTFLATLAGLFALAYVALYILVLGAIGYVAWEILFDDGLNRWFG